MASITLPTAATINVVATTSDYSTKSNLTEEPGSYLAQAAMLVYDDILRFQKTDNGYFTTAELADFDFDQFVGNVYWFMDELVGMESDWKKTASASSSTAYGYVQFTEASVETAVTRYITHLKSFNDRKDTRDWTPHSIKKGKELSTPTWLTYLKNAKYGRLIGTYYVPYYDHKINLDYLTFDQQMALAFVHLHSKTSKDSNFRLLSKGDVTAAKDIYKENHHTNPDAATLTRLELFFKIHYGW